MNCAWITVSLREGCGELEVQTTLIPVTTEGQLFHYSHAHCGTEYYSITEFVTVPYSEVNVKVSHKRPRWPKGFWVG